MTATTRASLHDSHVVVFGGSTGVGLATAMVAKSQGATITIVGRSPSKLKTAAKILGADQATVADLWDQQSVEAAFNSAERVDHLVITTGGFSTGRLIDTHSERFLATMKKRIAAPIYTIKAALPLMPCTGSIVLTGAQLSDVTSSGGMAAAPAAVRGVEELARKLALELKPIRVNVVSLGPTDTPLFDSFDAEKRASIFEQMASTLPDGRVRRAEKVAEAIIHLLRNGYMSGEVLHIDDDGHFV